MADFPLHRAARRGDGVTVMSLLNLETVNKSGKTALHHACENGHSKVAELLLDNGAHIDSADRDGCKTALHVAAYEGHEDTVQLLLSRGANVHAVDEEGRTALYFASEVGFWRTAEHLLKYGADVNATCTGTLEGSTPLHIAADLKNAKMVELLLSNGADMNAVDDNGETPLASACSFISNCYFSQAIQLLIKYIVKMKAQGLFICKINDQAISNNQRTKRFSERCEEEIKRMQKKTISDSNIKFFDILTKGENKLADYMANESVKKVMELRDYESEFPIYASVIWNQFLRGNERKDLLKESSELLYGVMNEFCKFPYICAEKVNRYLRSGDLNLQIMPKPHQLNSPTVTDVTITSVVKKDAMDAGVIQISKQKKIKTI